MDSVTYDCMVEFITTWKEAGEEVELYKCLTMSDLDYNALSKEVGDTIKVCRERAIAKSTPALEKSTVLLTKEAVRSFFSFYYDKASANTVYEEASTWKIGDVVQGEGVKGDLVSMKLDPFMKYSTSSGSFDEDGFSLKPVTLIKEGILERYAASTRYAHYLKVEPTGAIHNISVQSGSKTVEELKREPHLETAAFSDFTVDTLTGDFYGEIRLAWYFDGVITIPVTGGSISGNINELQREMYLSKELQKGNDFEGPEVIKLLNVTVAGIE